MTGFDRATSFFVCGSSGAVAGAGIGASVGSVGVVGSFGGVGLGATPFVAAGVVTGAAAYGAATAFTEGDPIALGAVGLGSIGGLGVSSAVGGLGVSFGSTAFGIGLGTMSALGGILGLGVYGLYKAATPEPGQRLSGAFDAFSRIEERVLEMDAYTQALIELDPVLTELNLQQKFTDLEIEDELQALKTQLQNSNREGSRPCSTARDPERERISTDLAIDDELSTDWQCVKHFKGHTNTVNDLAISPDGKFFASVSDDKTAILWDFATQRQTYCFFHGNSVYATALDAKNTLFTGDFDRNVTQWNLETFQHQQAYLDYFGHSHRGIVYTIATNPTHASIASGGSDNVVRIWHRYTGQVKRTLTVHTDTVRSLDYSLDGTYLVSGSLDGTACIWDVQRGNIVRKLARDAGILAVAISCDDRFVATGGVDRTIRVWDWQRGILRYVLSGHLDEVRSIDFHPNGELLVSASDREVKLWNLQTGQCNGNLDGTHPIAFAADGSFLMTGSRDRVLKRWEQQLYRSLSHGSEAWWQVLGVRPEATAETVKTAYWNLARIYHPDVNREREAIDRMQAINQAYMTFLQIVDRR
ncbi:MAG: DnaJ domain-containing protein [Cyanobacteria bacterium SBC]|nr:DnaJ domain-containing protein [Cyanobacteria bacterium SBC]